jgi:TRAP-type C4-dicarboxylate transport system substrate-binding protein
MTTDRRSLIAGSLAATAASVVPWGGAMAQQELKLASFVPPTHVIWTDVITPWTREVAKLSNNQLTVRMFPAMQLGGRPRRSSTGRSCRASPTSRSHYRVIRRATSR